MRIGIIGAGVVGCSAALALAREGHEVRVVDKNREVGHGSTAQSCGIVRRFYSQPGMVALAHEAASIWADWGAWLGPIDDGLAVFHRPGMLFIPPAIDDGLHGIVASMNRVGIRAEVLDAAQVAERFPFLDTASHHPARPVSDPAFFEDSGATIAGAVFEEGAGYVVSPDLATHNLRLAAEREGAGFLLGREVVGIAGRAGGGFALRLGEGTALEVDAVVNVAGPHSALVNRLAGVELELETRALRREVHVVTNPVYDPGEPKLPVVGDMDSGVYFRPEAARRDIVVGSADPACDALDWVEDPDHYREGVSDLYGERQCLRLMKRLPGVRLGSLKGISALYDVTVRDWYPVVDRTRVPGFFVAVGTSGSSFKTAPVLGRLVAAQVRAWEQGRDTDTEPLQLELPRTGQVVDTRFLGRLRGGIDSTGTVIG